MEDLIIDLNNLNNNTLKIAVILHEMEKGHKIVGNVNFSLFEIIVLDEKRIKHINTWNVSRVTKMDNLFKNTPDFNSNISDWNTKRVTNMSYMFANCENFNQNISVWNVSNVDKHTNMFRNCYIESIFKPVFKRDNELQTKYENRRNSRKRQLGG
jgi:hypothetical protein